jgi:hypothetical protein
MEDTVKKNKYCFDTSAFIDSWRVNYRFKSFEKLWSRIGELIKDGSIIIHEEVMGEVGSGDDDLIKWLKQYHAYVIHISSEQIKIVTEIVNKYQLVSQYRKPRPHNADPFVVALGKINSCTVVSQEKGSNSKDHPRIGDLCKEYGVDHCSISDFFEKEDWRFHIK